MTTYAQIVNGKVHGVFEYDPLPEFAPNIKMVSVENADPIPSAGWHYKETPEGVYFTEPAPEVVDYGTKITHYAMRKRFTFEERVAIETASDSDKSVKTLLKDMDSAKFIDLSISEINQGIQMLEQKGLLAAGRADEIINKPVQEHEI